MVAPQKQLQDHTAQNHCRRTDQRQTSHRRPCPLEFSEKTSEKQDGKSADRNEKDCVLIEADRQRSRNCRQNRPAPDLVSRNSSLIAPH